MEWPPAAHYRHMTFTDHSPIPHIDTVTDPFDGPDDLRQRWRALMGPLGFSERILWFIFTEDSRMLPTACQLELPDRPDAFLADVFLMRLHDLAAEDLPLSVAFLLSRPGRNGITADDVEWTSLLTAAAARHRVSIHPIHRANDLTLVTMPQVIEQVA